MADPFISEIRMWCFNWAPRDWALCDGASLPVSQNPALYSLLGTNFGGNGQTSFNLPDLRGRVPVSKGIHSEMQYQTGNHGGVENVTLTAQEMATHTHEVRGTTAAGDTKQFTNAIFASGYDSRTQQATDMYNAPSNLTTLSSNTVSSNGGNDAHTNVQPSLVVNFCIALTGAFPPRN